MKFSVLLYNIRSAHNVGSIMRTADAAGFSQVYLTGYTPSPQDRFGRMRPDIAKVALGAEQSLLWSHHDDIKVLLEELREKKVYLLALEQSENSFQYDQVVVPPEFTECVLVVGEETKGIESELLSYMDAVVEIPMRGTKESLNVSVAFGISAYELVRSCFK